MAQTSELLDLGFIAVAYVEHAPRLRQRVRNLVGDDALAEDAVQEAFARLVKATADGRAPENTRAWLYRVLANLVTSSARRRLVAVRHLPFMPGGDPAVGAEEEFLRGEVDPRIAVALDALSQGERTALLLAARGVPGRDVAAAIGRSEAATRTLMCRARMRLRQQLK